MKPSEREKRFVGYLQALHHGGRRGVLAAFKKGLGKPPGAVPEMLRHLAPWTSNLNRRCVAHYFLVASLYACHPHNTKKGNFGDTMAAAHKKQAGTNSMEIRFMHLLAAAPEDLEHCLRRAVSLLHSSKQPVNWARLLHDLAYWDDPDKRVQTAWAETFWSDAKHMTEE